MLSTDLDGLPRAVVMRDGSAGQGFIGQDHHLHLLPTGPLRVIVTGGRHYNDAARVEAVLRAYPIAALAHGAAAGADSLAAAAAAQLPDVSVQPFPADWLGPCFNTCRPGHRRTRRGPGGRTQSYCPSAGIYRNQDMLDEFTPDLVIAFPGGRGTADMVRRATERLGVGRVVVIE